MLAALWFSPAGSFSSGVIIYGVALFFSTPRGQKLDALTKIAIPVYWCMGMLFWLREVGGL